MNRPNILFLCTDQQRFDTINAAGNPYIRTPHFNWLAESGIHFRRCYSDSPVCVTARATMITGRHYHRLGGYGWWGKPTAPDATKTLPALLTQAGYQTKAVGKLHYHPARCNYGFEHTEILQDYYRYMRRHPHLGLPMDHGIGQNEMEPALATVDESHSLTRWTVERAMDFLETRDTTRPFFMHVGFAKPHPPFDPCRNYWEMYRDAEVPEPVYGDWSKDEAKIPAGFMGPTWQLNGCDNFSPALLREVRRAYYACLTQIDYNLGYLFGRMREMGLLDNTLILLTADHGEMLGDHHLGAKSVFLEGSAHIPLLVRPPKGMIPDTQRGGSSDALVCLADIMPTCLNAAGVKAPRGVTMDGADLLGKPGHDHVVGLCGDQLGIVQGDWKYLFTTSGGGELLFNLTEDPYEQKNLAATAAKQRRQLRAQLAKELGREKHPAVKNGDLRALQPSPTRRAVRANAWPGWHTRIEENDVLH